MATFTTDSDQGNGTTATISLAPSAGDTVVIGFAVAANVTVTVSDSLSTAITFNTPTAGGYRTGVYYKYNCTGSEGDITITWTGADDYVAAGVKFDGAGTAHVALASQDETSSRTTSADSGDTAANITDSNVIGIGVSVAHGPGASAVDWTNTHDIQNSTTSVTQQIEAADTTNTLAVALWSKDTGLTTSAAGNAGATTTNVRKITAALFVDAGAAAQDITPQAETVDATPGTVTVSPGGVGITPGAITITTTPGGLTVTTSNAITPVGPTVTSSPGTLTVAPGAASITPDATTVTVSPGTLVVTEAGGTQDITPAATTVTTTPGTLQLDTSTAIAPVGPTVTATPGGLTVSPGAVAVTPAAITITSTPGGLTVAPTQTITPVGPTVTATPGSPSLTTGAVGLTLLPAVPAITPGTLVVTGGTLTIDWPEAGRYYRNADDERLHLFWRGTTRGLKASESWEVVSEQFVFDYFGVDDVESSVAAAWAANSSADQATLKAAIDAALNGAGYRRFDGSSLV